LFQTDHFIILYCCSVISRVNISLSGCGSVMSILASGDERNFARHCLLVAAHPSHAAITLHLTKDLKEIDQRFSGILQTSTTFLRRSVQSV
ncbi:hypothetical protein DFH28DRAFT_857577, partial [Melampsora americana]